MLEEKVIYQLRTEDLAILEQNSPLASRLSLFDHFVIRDNKTSEAADYFNQFHPNGDCGCIEMCDDYLGNLRCNHLIWIDGTLEIEPCNYATLLVANHKGVLLKTLIIWGYSSLINNQDEDRSKD